MISTTAVHNASADTTTTAKHRDLHIVLFRPPAWATSASDAQASEHDSGDRVSLSTEGLARPSPNPEPTASRRPREANHPPQAMGPTTATAGRR